MYFKQHYTPGLAHCSYVIGTNSQCLVVDPDRHIEPYLSIAAAWGLPITGVIETHLHADFVSGHLELATQTGATIYAPRAAQCEFEHIDLEDGETFEFDGLTIRAIATPGHTPEGAVVVVTDQTRGHEPCLAFTGDTLLVGDVGRPDLFPDKQEVLAEALFDSIQKLGEVPDYVELYPAHGMGSLCGKALSPKLTSTFGIERRQNQSMRATPLARFVDQLLDGMPQAPDHFGRCSEINRKGPSLIHDLDTPAALSPQDFQEHMARGYTVIDARDQLAFASAHIPGSLAIYLQGNFSTLAGWVTPPQKPILLVLNDDADLQAALRGLRRVGLDKVAGYLRGGITAWIQQGLETESLESISAQELYRRHQQGDIQLVDTRLAGERQSGHVANDYHIAGPDLRTQSDQLDPRRPVAVLCGSGNRSILAASILLQQGFSDVMNLIGGIMAWRNAGLPLEPPRQK